jgi:hypothetical protein
MTRWTVALVTILVLGCGNKGGGGASTPTPENPGAGFDERQACTVDTDCVAVEIACCDHCNGGTAVGVHKDAAAEVAAEYAGPAKCGETMCTQMACAVAEPICRQDRCGVRVGTEEQMTPLPRP